MKRILTSCCLFYFAINSANGQNLVPNPGFEIYSTCPYNQGQIAFATNWFNPGTATPDYFNSCYDTTISSFTPNVHVPDNMIGWQYAHGGEAYAGIISIIFNLNFPYPVALNTREYIGTKLLLPLQACKKYDIEFYVSYANNSSVPAGLIGAYFSRDSIIQPLVSPNLNVIPQIVSDSLIPITDTLNWIKVSGSFTASGGERFLTMGIFADDFSMPMDSFQAGFAYYYIDDVSIIPSNEESCIDFIVPNVFTPNGDNQNDLFEIMAPGMIESRLKIYNRWGVLVFESPQNELNWNGQTSNGELCQDGTYYCIVEGKGRDNSYYFKKGFLQLVH